MSRALKKPEGRKPVNFTEPLFQRNRVTMGSSGLVGSINKLAERYGAHGPPPDLDDDDDEEDDEDYDGEDEDDSGDDDSEEEEEGEEGEEEGDDDDDDDDEEDDEDDDDTDERFGEQAKEVTMEEFEKEEKEGEHFSDSEFVKRPIHARAGQFEAHDLQEEHDDDLEEDAEFPEDKGPALRVGVAGVWRRCMARYAVLNLTQVLADEENKVLDADCCARIAMATREFKKMMVAIEDFKREITNRAEPDGPGRRLHELVVRSLRCTTVAWANVEDMVALHGAGYKCDVNGFVIGPRGGYLLVFTEDSHKFAMTLSQRAAYTVMAVNYICRFLVILNIEAASTVISDVDKACSAAEVSPAALLRRNCLVDGRGLVDATYKVLLRQLILLKGIIYPDLRLHGIFAAGYAEYESAVNKKKADMQKLTGSALADAKDMQSMAASMAAMKSEMKQ
jgi:hypothetical protein